jgi:hypothetical protein
MNEQDPIARRARELFEQASRQSGPAAINRLRIARRMALSASPRRRAPLLPLAAAASLLALAMAWWLPRQETASIPAGRSASADQAVMESDEDSEIYAWLSDAPVAPDDGKAGAL